MRVLNPCHPPPLFLAFCWAFSVLPAPAAGQTSPFTIPTLDLSMPGMGGQDVFERLRKKAPVLPIIFTSGYDPADATEVASDDTYVRFLQKPFRPAVLLEEVLALLAD